ncbi:CHAT domain-containing protein [Kibdelosporangium phytohabitans]|uniref:CHAT domain-containing protein n=1 Tax=Kibdelosporangium phytohabitans TaxID=860235 RepID=A0A0N9HT45_9PSEU|nr:CHAT domain-containing protein [Kibdelosporangium phytohabitans]ALG06384.1 hypothetical protein AOZ06_05095 [Kibdelosporangium phytohabitans]
MQQGPAAAGGVDVLLAKLQERMKAFLMHGDMRAIDDNALAEAAEVLRMSARPAELMDLPGHVALQLGWVHWCRFLALVDEEPHYATALTLFRSVHAVSPDKVPGLPRWLIENSGSHPSDVDMWSMLAALVLQQEADDPHVPTLRQVAGLLDRVLAAAPEDHPERQGWLYNQGMVFGLLHRNTYRLTDLYRCWSCLQQALVLTPPGHPHRDRNEALLDKVRIDPDRLSERGIAALAQHHRTGELTSAEDAVAAFRCVADVTPSGHPKRASILNNLGTALLTTFERIRSADDLAEAISVLREAVAEAEYDFAWSTLSQALRHRFELSRDASDLDDAVDAARQALIATGEGAIAPLWSNLGATLHDRFAHSGAPADLDEAITALRRACADDGTTGPAPLAALDNLGSSLISRGSRTGTTTDIDEAVAIHRSALEQSPEGTTGHARRAGNLANALVARFELVGGATGLDEAIALLDSAVRGLGAADPRQAVEHLADLAACMVLRYNLANRRHDLEQALVSYHQCLDFHDEDFPARRVPLDGLGMALVAAYEHDGRLADLDAGIGALREACAITPQGGRGPAPTMSRLGTALRERFVRSAELQDIDEAVNWLRAAVDAAPHGDDNRPAALTHLCGALHTRYQSTGDHADLDDAIDAGRRAVDATPDGSPHYGARLGNLAGAVVLRGLRTRERADADEALRLNRRAVKLLGQDHRDAPLARHNLALCLEIGRPQDNDRTVREARDTFREVAGNASASPTVRVHAGIGWARCSARAGNWADAARGYAAAIDLLPMLASRTRDRDDWEHGLGDLAGLAANAAAAALNAGDRALAVQLLEQGRGVLLAQEFDERGDLTVLARSAPDLADDHTRLRNLLNTLGTDVRHGVARRALVRQWHELVDQIRLVPGMERFHRRLSVKELLAEAAQGPIVMLNVSRHRSDALILTRDRRIVPVPLQDLTPDVVAAKVGEFTTRIEEIAAPGAGIRERFDAERGVRELLTWLWTTVCGPVLAALPADTARIWWSPTGLLTTLPLHAAGVHGEPGDSVLDRAVSSYTPTVEVLRRARTRQRPQSTSTSALVVSVGRFEGDALTTLPVAAEEVDIVRRRYRQTVAIVDAEATRDRVLDALDQRHEVVHFACHGHSDLTDPSRAYLALHDHLRHPLTALDIAARDLPDVRLAFLSACHTTRTRDALADEAVHITASFLVAGFPHVVGTLWSVDDNVARSIAADFYSDLDEVERSAEALHHAIRARRDDAPLTPSLWAAHLHVGP